MPRNNNDNTMNGAISAYTGSLGSIYCKQIDIKNEINNQLLKNYKVFSHQHIHKTLNILLDMHRF